MAGNINPDITIKLDRERRLVFGLRAMRAFEEATGKNLLQLGQGNELTAGEIGVFFWACLLHDDRELTLDRAIELIDTHSNIREISALIGQARKQGMPNVPEKEE